METVRMRMENSKFYKPHMAIVYFALAIVLFMFYTLLGASFAPSVIISFPFVILALATIAVNNPKKSKLNKKR